MGFSTASYPPTTENSDEQIVLRVSNWPKCQETLADWGVFCSFCLLLPTCKAKLSSSAASFSCKLLKAVSGRNSKTQPTLGLCVKPEASWVRCILGKFRSHCQPWDWFPQLLVPQPSHLGPRLDYLSSSNMSDKTGWISILRMIVKGGTFILI